MVIQSYILATTTLNSSNVHLKQMSQFIISIASDTSSPVAPEILGATHVASSSDKLRVTASGTSSYSSKATHVVSCAGVSSYWGAFPRGLTRLVVWFWYRGLTGADTPPPFLYVASCTEWRSFPNITVLWKFHSRPSSSSSP